MDSISHPNAAEDRGLRKWFFLALLLSLAFHAVLAFVFQAKKLEHFETGPVAPRLVRRPEFARHDYQKEVFLPDTPPAKPTTDTSAKLTSPPAPPVERPTADVPKNVTLTPRATEPPKLVSEKPDVKTSGALDTKGDSVAQHEAMNLGERLIEQQPINPAAQKQVPFPTSGNSETETVGSTHGTGYSGLNELLGRTGELKGPVAPVNMPGGALFEYDSATLRRDAIPNLQKLGELIARNPRATFSIEGHTDSFGTAQYNFDLSRRRAEAVKDWLVQNMHLDPSKIQTQGFGSTRLIVPTGSKEEQQMNRRVEIVIRTPNK
jgi:outer membrane protein OmpA-like peptidoglycan-associated protein